jgi:hypothetical protein
MRHVEASSVNATRSRRRSALDRIEDGREVRFQLGNFAAAQQASACAPRCSRPSSIVDRRPAEAVLSPALESFSPTPEMPKIAEARAQLAALVR